ncbi:MAG: COX15/CtaA family protein [Planctomycetales bacterium]|nr:COX15/CtaA family protein [Planctomycetales bacterium]
MSRRVACSRLAFVTAAATFGLLVAGGFVTSLEVGLAVPDWPTTFGHGMFTAPWGDLAPGARVEHFHRLAGSVVGLLTVGLAVAAFLGDPRRGVRLAAAVAVLGVVAQGILGGLRVTDRSLALALVHGCVAPAFFALVVGIAAATAGSGQAGGAQADPGAPRRRAAALVAVLYVQGVLGAVVRHTGSLLELHLAGMVVAVVAIVAAAGRASMGREELRAPALALHGFLAVQIGLGFGAWALAQGAARLAPPTAAGVLVATAHMAVGHAMLACAVVLALRARGIAAGRGDPIPAAPLRPALALAGGIA